MPRTGDSTHCARVLLVDDNTIFLKLISRIVESVGFKAIGHSRSYGILGLVAQHRPEVVLLDIQMPGLDGASVADLINNYPDPAMRPRYLLLCSSLEPAPLAKRAAECCADGAISKCVGLKQMQLELKTWLAKVPRT